MKYDYVGKMETLNLDNSRLSTLLGSDSSVRYRLGHINKFVSGEGGKSANYKYDEILRDFERQEPEVFKRLLRWYSNDMELFGYTWQKGQSGCKYAKLGCC